jgi:hypothetical protein
MGHAIVQLSVRLIEEKIELTPVELQPTFRYSGWGKASDEGGGHASGAG